MAGLKSIRKTGSVLGYVIFGLLLAIQINNPAYSGPLISSSKNQLNLTRWERIPTAESRISLVGKENLVRGRRVRADQSGTSYTEAISLRIGSIIYEKKSKLRKRAILSGREQILKRYAKNRELKSLGLMVRESAIREKSDASGKLAYLVTESRRKKCFIFFRYDSRSQLVPTWNQLGEYQAITGTLCLSPKSSSAKNLLTDSLDFVSQVLFDDGQHTRNQMLSQAFDKLDARESRIAPPEKIAPMLNKLQSRSLSLGRLEVSGHIDDDSNIDMLRIDGSWVVHEQNGEFKVTLAAIPPTGESHIVALDQFGNRSEKKLKHSQLRSRKGDENQEEKATRYHALLFGNSNYTHWRDLKTPQFDVDKLGQVLRNRFGFKSIKTFKDAKKETILATLESLRRKLSSEDNFLIYFSGHGILHKGNGYWVPVDGRMDDPDLWVPNSDITRAIRRIPARHIMVVADSCYSGTLAAGSPSSTSESTTAKFDSWSRTALSAGGGDEVVLEPLVKEGEVKYSVFLKQFLKTLEKSVKSSTAGGVIHKEVKHRLRMFPQTPQYGKLFSAGHEPGSDFKFPEPL
jgi:hypothetical protein